LARHQRLAQDSNALIVGVTGHRPHRLVPTELDALRQQVRDAVAALLAHAAERGVLLLSPLAAGADQLMASAALAAGCRLVCPIPFSREEYAHDFTEPQARAAYQALLARADDVIELPGSRATPERADAAYAAVGAYIVEQAAVLLAIWDGEPAHGPGGTAHVLASAVAARLPVVCVGAHPPHDICVLVTRERDQVVKVPLAELPHILMARAPST
jgi:hypothetical protein